MYLITGYLGYSNYGDELLARIVEAQIRKRDRLASFKRLSSKTKFLDHFDYIKECREMICVGGLFQDSSSLLSVVYYFLLIFFAKMNHKRVRIIAQGIGPLNSPLAKFFTKLAFRMADWISVRDKASSYLLKEWKIDHYYGSDLAWLIDSETRISDDSKQKIHSIFGPPGRSLVAVSLRTNKTQNDEGLIYKILDSLPVNYGYSPVLILQMQDQDQSIHKKFAEIDAEMRCQNNYFIDANEYSAEELVYILKNYCSNLIGMRLHALILARIAGIELTPIAFDPKIKELRDQIEIYSNETLHERAQKHFSLI